MLYIQAEMVPFFVSTFLLSSPFFNLLFGAFRCDVIRFYAVSSSFDCSLSQNTCNTLSLNFLIFHNATFFYNTNRKQTYLSVFSSVDTFSAIVNGFRS